MINCFMVSKISLTDSLRYVLYRSAWEMFQKEEQVRSIKTGECEGQIRCEYKHGSLGGIRGTMFSATLETDLGTGKVSFIVKDGDLLKEEDGIWVDLHMAGPAPTPEYVN